MKFDETRNVLLFTFSKYFFTTHVWPRVTFFGRFSFSGHIFYQSTSLFDVAVGTPRGKWPQKTVLNRPYTVSMPNPFDLMRYCFILKMLGFWCNSP